MIPKARIQRKAARLAEKNKSKSNCSAQRKTKAEVRAFVGEEAQPYK